MKRGFEIYIYNNGIIFMFYNISHNADNFVKKMMFPKRGRKTVVKHIEKLASQNPGHTKIYHYKSSLTPPIQGL